VQLSVLGYILVPIFRLNRWWLTLAYSLFMVVVAAVEAVSRPALAYPGMLLQVRLRGAGFVLGGRGARASSSWGSNGAVGWRLGGLRDLGAMRQRLRGGAAWACTAARRHRP
jgi:hypothetical protein